MTPTSSSVNSIATIAPLRNVTRFTEMVEKLNRRDPALPGFGVFSGRAGLGKTCAATFAINEYRAFYVECDYTWTQRALCAALMVELGMIAPGTPLPVPIYRAVEIIGNYLAERPSRPLIIDEADFLVKKKMIEIVRAIYKHCAPAGSSIILIGEENMPNALKQWERISSRVLCSVKAEPADLNDILVLSGLVCPNLSFHPDVIKGLKVCTDGSARRVVTKLYSLLETAKLDGLKKITLEAWNPAEAN